MASEEPKLSKNAQRKLEQKAKKEALKQQAKKDNEQKNQQSVEETANNYGVLPLIQSQSKDTHKYYKIRDLDEKLDGQVVWVRARLHNSRGKGNLSFLILRQSLYTVQGVLVKGNTISKGMLNFVSKLTKESILDIEAKVTVPKDPIESTTQKQIELSIQQLFVVSAAETPLPLQITDAEVSEPLLIAQNQEVERLTNEIDALKEELNNTKDDKKKEIEEKIAELTKQKGSAKKYATVSQDQRLDNRVIDLRTTTNQCIFRIQSAVGQLFREFLLSKNFTEIHTPKIISAASEGGADVFKVQYFQGNAYLAQSPQLFKQMAICSDLDRVFEIAPVFRAENSNTHRHLTEFVGLDMEMAFSEHYHEVLDVLDEMFVFIFDELKKRWAKELEVIKVQFPFEDLVYHSPKSLRLKYSEAIKLLQEAGESIKELDDIGTQQEKLLGKLVKEKYNTDFFILDKFPASVRPFYTMNDPEDPNYTNSYDFFLRGEEILSGAQRIHDPVLLEAKAKEKGVAISTIQAYIDAFKYGAPPHGGGGIGLERVTMLYLSLKNIRKTSMFPRDPLRLSP